MRNRYVYEIAERKRVALLTRVTKRVFNQVDPERLLACGAPDDEYEPEAREAAKQIDRERGIMGVMELSQEEIAHVFALVLHMAFGQWTLPVVVHDKDHELARLFLEEEAAEKAVRKTQVE